MGNFVAIQNAIFEEIKGKLNPEQSLVHEISELLCISNDSAYRRIRGEKELSVDELYKLSTHYHISMDAIFQLQKGKVIFDPLALKPGSVEISEWFEKIKKDLHQIQFAKNATVSYSAKDAPFFHYFQIPELAAFKIFFWQKTLFQFPEFSNKTFSLEEMDDAIIDQGQSLLLLYNKIPSIELWNEDTFNIMLRQIEYYYISGFFSDKSDVSFLCDKLEIWVRHMQNMAEHGFKYLYGQDPQGVDGNFTLYENEVVLNDNTILVDLDGLNVVYLTYNVISLLQTTDQHFCKTIADHFKGVMKKSTLISSSAAKARHRFFNNMIEQVNAFRKRLV